MRRFAPPPPAGLLREGLGALEILRLGWRLPDLMRRPAGRGEPVVVLPGFGADDASCWALRTYLRRLGYDVCGWGLGRNSGNVPELMPRVVDRVEAVARGKRRTLSLVGWSLGGYLAREAARDRPDLVARVITLGTPVVGGPKYTALAGLYRRGGVDVDAIERAVDERNRTPLRVPVTAIYSRADGVVAWEACIDAVSPDVEHVEVGSTHLGLGFDPDVYAIVAERLRQDVRGRARDDRPAGGGEAVRTKA